MRMPSEAQVKLLSQAYNRGISVQMQGRDGAPAWVTPTHNALIKAGWLASDGSPEYEENGFVYQRQMITAAGFEALGEYFARKAMRR